MILKNQRGPDTRGRIQKAALRLFVERGVDAVSLRDIAKDVGIEAPSIYTHFVSREVLLASLFYPNYSKYGERIKGAALLHSAFKPKLSAMMEVICTLHDEDGILFNFLMISQHAHLKDIDVNAANPVDIILQEIQNAIAQGEIPEQDAVLAASSIIGIVQQAATFHFYGRQPRNLLAMKAELIELALRVVMAG